MRKLKLQVQMTIDGYVGGPNGEMDWVFFNWDAELMQYVGTLTESMDCIVMGRKLAEGFIPYWAAVAAKPDDPQVASGKVFTNTPKVVFTKTLDESPWDNTTLAKGDLVEEITKLKAAAGKDLITYGGATLAADLIKHGLIDELYLFVNPAAIGHGLSVFQTLTGNQAFTLKQAQAFSCGIVLLCYEPVRA
ncbi:MAG: dihydrofolate reductase family protein [Caldilineaceae bacterium]|nr:dihydrofolate reductase family protein [Caldilineaceae bacterium]